jgi:hypothetical protein
MMMPATLRQSVLISAISDVMRSMSFLLSEENQSFASTTFTAVDDESSRKSPKFSEIDVVCVFFHSRPRRSRQTGFPKHVIRRLDE